LYNISLRNKVYMKGFDIMPKRLTRFSSGNDFLAETFVKTIKTECLNKLILTSEAQLRHFLRTYENFYNTQRHIEVWEKI
jgi:hypothetical protein